MNNRHSFTPNDQGQLISVVTFERAADAQAALVAPEMLALLKELNSAFYVKGTHKALLAVMAKTKPLIARAEGEP